jgi:hypothetical protein
MKLSKSENFERSAMDRAADKAHGAPEGSKIDRAQDRRDGKYDRAGGDHRVEHPGSGKALGSANSHMPGVPKMDHNPGKGRGFASISKASTRREDY